MKSKLILCAAAFRAVYRDCRLAVFSLRVCLETETWTNYCKHEAVTMTTTFFLTSTKKMSGL